MTDFDIDKLYDIVTRLKYTRDERRDCKAALAKSPSHSLHTRHAKATLEYMHALQDFNEMIEAYSKWKDEDDEE